MMKTFFSVLILMPAVVLAVFFWAPPALNLGHAGKIFYFHVPLAWVSVVAFLYSGFFSVYYLKNPSPESEFRSRNSAVIGLLFTVLTIISGSIWAGMSWGSYWNWDPRQTSIVMLMMIYIAYFSLGTVLKGSSARGRISAIYMIFTAVSVPFFIFVAPRIYPGLHPDPIINPDRKMHIEAGMRAVLFLSLAAFTLLYASILSALNRLSRIELDIEEKKNEKYL